ncbi:MAG: NAD-dependent epimerase/dehydratase family protein, partial [Candidatus Xenobia bacterium]
DGVECVAWDRGGVDLTDGAAVCRAMSQVRPTHVVHLAASTDRRREAEVWPHLLESNVRVTMNLAMALPEGVSMLHTGTLEEYGSGPAPFVETQQASPLSPYAASKAAAAAFCTMAGGTHVRLGLVYGPGQSDRYFIPQLLDATTRQQELEMTGGEQQRDFIYIDDVVEGLLRLEGVRGEYVNLCTGDGRRLRDVVGVVEQVLRRRCPVKLGALPYRKGEVFVAVGSVAKLRELTGWTPQFRLEAGLESLLNPV